MNFWDLIMPNTVRYNLNLEKRPNVVWNIAVDQVKRAKKPKKYEDLLIEQLLDINPEGELLKEIKDILDELHMMTKVYNEQQTVVKDFSSYMQQLAGSSKEISQRTKSESIRLVKEISRRKAEIHELIRAAERTADGVGAIILEQEFG